jgi:hypothetical protein
MSLRQSGSDVEWIALAIIVATFAADGILDEALRFVDAQPVAGQLLPFPIDVEKIRRCCASANTLRVRTAGSTASRRKPIASMAAGRGR